MYVREMNTAVTATIDLATTAADAVEEITATTVTTTVAAEAENDVTAAAVEDLTTAEVVATTVTATAEEITKIPAEVETDVKVHRNHLVRQSSVYPSTWAIIKTSPRQNFLV